MLGHNEVLACTFSQEDRLQRVQAGRPERQPDLSASHGTEQSPNVFQVLSATGFACMTCPYFLHLNGTKFVPLQDCFSERPS